MKISFFTNNVYIKENNLWLENLNNFSDLYIKQSI